MIGFGALWSRWGQQTAEDYGSLSRQNFFQPFSGNQFSHLFFTEVLFQHLHWRWHQILRDTLIRRAVRSFQGFWGTIGSLVIFESTSQFLVLHTYVWCVLQLACTGFHELTVTSLLKSTLGSITLVAWNQPHGDIDITEIGKCYRWAPPNGNEKQRDQVTFSMLHSSVAVA